MSDIEEPIRKINGRRAAIQCLDSVLEDSDNIHLLKSGLRDALVADPVTFYQKIVLPSTPIQMLLPEGEDAQQILRLELIPATKKVEGED